MDTLVHFGLLNAVLATVLALLAAAARLLRFRPASVHALWLLVLLKLITPPFLAIPIGWLPRDATTPPAHELISNSTPGTGEHDEPTAHSREFVSSDQSLPQLSERPDEFGASSSPPMSLDTGETTSPMIPELDEEVS